MRLLQPTNVDRAFQADAEDWLSVDEAKAHLRVTWSEDDALIEQLVAESARWVARHSGRPVVASRWTFTFGPERVAPAALICDGLEAGASLVSTTVSVAGASAVAQATKPQPFFDRARRELAVELVDPPDVDDDNRATWTVVVDLPSPPEFHDALRRARLLYIGAHFDHRDGEVDPRTWLKSAERALAAIRARAI